MRYTSPIFGKVEWPWWHDVIIAAPAILMVATGQFAWFFAYLAIGIVLLVRIVMALRKHRHLDVGKTIIGTGIPPGTVITSVTSPTSFEIGPRRRWWRR